MIDPSTQMIDFSTQTSQRFGVPAEFSQDGPHDFLDGLGVFGHLLNHTI